MWGPGSEPVLDGLYAQVHALRDALLAAEQVHADVIGATHPMHRRSAANLVHYVELRRHDVRSLQAQLTALGLSSLGRSEADVLPAVDAVLTILARLGGAAPPGPTATAAPVAGADQLRANTERLLGAAPADRTTRIMVTLPGAAAADHTLVGAMVDAGMDLARINCAHDDASHWAAMAQAVHAHPREDGRRCQLAMDLAGPKLRTGPLIPGPLVVKVGPRRDPAGRMVEPARLWLSADGSTPPDAGGPSSPVAVPVAVPVDDLGWIARRRVGDRITLRDARGAHRRWEVEAVTPHGCLATCEQTSYVATGTALRCHPAHPEGGGGTHDAADAEETDDARVGALPERALAHRVRVGDRVILTRDLTPTEPNPAGAVHRIGCTLPEAFVSARTGQRVWLDDGRFGGSITRVDTAEMEIVIDTAPPGGGNLKGAKGINLPETDLALIALTDKDLEDLDVVVRHADIVALSFVRRPVDVGRLQDELHRRGGDQLGLLVKIETAAAFTNLPGLLLTALRSPRVGVMIARGDLAVEVGFERLAEVQEEILWICEAAHVPVVWATQVLDTVARSGRRTRAEITDAAMGHRAECVMLNKGDHVTEAISVLDDVLRRMERHHRKKRSLLSRLESWDGPGGARSGQMAGSGRP